MPDPIIIPRFYKPWPHQQRAWIRRSSGRYTYYFKLWARQAGKDTDDIEHAMSQAWDHPGTQTAYVGLDNKWVNQNIFNKYIDGRTFWMDYPEEMIEPKDTRKEVLFKNNPKDKAEARIQFIGFLNDQALIGSSFDSFYVSEASLYKRNAFQFIKPIWERKLARGLPLNVSFNGTPRGMKNEYYELMRTYTGEDDPEAFPGEHHVKVGDTWCYVDKVTIRDLVAPNAQGEMARLYNDEDIEFLKAQYMRAYGNLNLYYQENECDFTVVNAGLVYQGFEQLVKDGRLCPYNLNPSEPVYVAFDIASKDKITDATAGLVYQFINDRMIIYDWIEERGKALVEVVAELAKRPYFHLIRMGVLPWDSERSASSESPLDEVSRVYDKINWHALEKERVDRGINLVRRLIPNMIVNSTNCDYIVECFNNYEYKRLEKQDDWTPKPMHNRYSHLMDALRYAAMGIGEMQYFHLNSNGDEILEYGEYGGFVDDKPKQDVPITYRKPKKERFDGYTY